LFDFQVTKKNPQRGRAGGVHRFSLGPGVDYDGICPRIVPSLLVLVEERGDKACANLGAQPTLFDF
jgi:hypothetical protein